MNEQGHLEDEPTPYLSKHRLEELERLVPEHDHHGLIAFINDGIVPGSFLQAVLENNLREAFGRADLTNRAALFDIVSWLYNDAPADCWGSPEKVMAWSKARRRIPEEEKLVCPECGK
jgi:hypothetical protein